MEAQVSEVAASQVAAEQAVDVKEIVVVAVPWADGEHEAAAAERMVMERVCDGKVMNGY